jgi:hypothetical protein
LFHVLDHTKSRGAVTPIMNCQSRPNRATERKVITALKSKEEGMKRRIITSREKEKNEF